MSHSLDWRHAQKGLAPQYTSNISSLLFVHHCSARLLNTCFRYSRYSSLSLHVTRLTALRGSPCCVSPLDTRPNLQLPPQLHEPTHSRDLQTEGSRLVNKPGDIFVHSTGFWLFLSLRNFLDDLVWQETPLNYPEPSQKCSVNSLGDSTLSVCARGFC